MPYFKRPNFIPCHPEMLLSRFGLLSRLPCVPVCRAVSLVLVLSRSERVLLSWDWSSSDEDGIKTRKQGEHRDFR